MNFLSSLFYSGGYKKSTTDVFGYDLIDIPIDDNYIGAGTNTATAYVYNSINIDPISKTITTPASSDGTITMWTGGSYNAYTYLGYTINGSSQNVSIYQTTGLNASLPLGSFAGMYVCNIAPGTTLSYLNTSVSKFYLFGNITDPVWVKLTSSSAGYIERIGGIYWLKCSIHDAQGTAIKSKATTSYDYSGASETGYSNGNFISVLKNSVGYDLSSTVGTGTTMPIELKTVTGLILFYSENSNTMWIYVPSTQYMYAISSSASVTASNIEFSDTNEKAYVNCPYTASGATIYVLQILI